MGSLEGERRRRRREPDGLIAGRREPEGLPAILVRSLHLAGGEEAGPPAKALLDAHDAVEGKRDAR